MVSHMILAVAALGIGLSVPNADKGMVIDVRGDCSAAARQALAENGGTLLSVEPAGDQCVITILVQNNGERPKKKVVHKPM